MKTYYQPNYSPSSLLNASPAFLEFTDGQNGRWVYPDGVTTEPSSFAEPDVIRVLKLKPLTEEQAHARLSVAYYRGPMGNHVLRFRGVRGEWIGPMFPTPSPTDLTREEAHRLNMPMITEQEADELLRERPAPSLDDVPELHDEVQTKCRGACVKWMRVDHRIFRVSRRRVTEYLSDGRRIALADTPATWLAQHANAVRISEDEANQLLREFCFENTCDGWFVPVTGGGELVVHVRREAPALYYFADGRVLEVDSCPSVYRTGPLANLYREVPEDEGVSRGPGRTGFFVPVEGTDRYGNVALIEAPAGRPAVYHYVDGEVEESRLSAPDFRKPSVIAPHYREVMEPEAKTILERLERERERKDKEEMSKDGWFIPPSSPLHGQVALVFATVGKSTYYNREGVAYNSNPCSPSDYRDKNVLGRWYEEVSEEQAREILRKARAQATLRAAGGSSADASPVTPKFRLGQRVRTTSFDGLQCTELGVIEAVMPARDVDEATRYLVKHDRPIGRQLRFFGTEGRDYPLISAVWSEKCLSLAEQE